MRTSEILTGRKSRLDELKNHGDPSPPFQGLSLGWWLVARRFTEIFSEWKQSLVLQVYTLLGDVMGRNKNG